MQVDAQVLVVFGIPAVGALAWLFRLEARINVNEALTRRLIEDVSYIRRRIDEALQG